MKKLKKLVSMDPSPSYAFDEDAKTRLKHQNLMQDYNELQKETEAMKKKLQRIKKKKLTLLAEVRYCFLRRRYKYLVNNPSEKTRSESLIQPQNHEIRIENSVKERNYREKPASKPIFSPAFDLNQKGEETEEWEPLRIEKKSKRPLIEGNGLENDLNLTICRDVENGSNRARRGRLLGKIR